MVELYSMLMALLRGRQCKCVVWWWQTSLVQAIFYEFSTAGTTRDLEANKMAVGREPKKVHTPAKKKFLWSHL
jgi:hypothetical protein